MTVRTKALVLRAMPIGDNDRLLTMLSEELGVIKVSARGATRGGSRMAAIAQPLMYGEYMLFRGTTRYSLNGGDILVSFFDLALEPAHYEVAIRLLSYAEDAGMVPESGAEVLALSLRMLRRMMPGKQRTVSPGLVAATYLFKMSQIAGLAPHVTSCVRCGTTAIDDIRFSQDAGGFLCEQCSPEDPSAVRIPTGVAKAILYTLCAPVETLFHFDLEPALTDTFAQLAESYMSYRWESRRRQGPSLYATGKQSELP